MQTHPRRTRDRSALSWLHPVSFGGKQNGREMSGWLVFCQIGISIIFIQRHHRKAYCTYSLASSVQCRVEKERMKKNGACQSSRPGFGRKEYWAQTTTRGQTRHKRTFCVGSSQLTSTEEKRKRDDLAVVSRPSRARCVEKRTQAYRRRSTRQTRTFVVGSSPC